MPDSRLLERLIELRRTVRTRLVVFGVCAVTGGGTLVFLVMVGLDWLLHLPPWLRLVIGLVAVAGAVVALWHWVVKSILRPIGLPQLAGKLEEYRWQFEGGNTGAFDDRLSSTVDFLLGNEAGSEQMRRQVIAGTDRLVTNIRFQDALSLRPLLTCAGALVVAVGLLVVTEAASPGFARTGLQRLVAPFSAVRWPRHVEIVPLSGDAAVPVGESTTLSMKVVRGLTPTLRGLVHLRSPDGEVTRLTMQREGADEFVCDLGAVAEDLICWFEAGDDHTGDRPIRIRAVQRPAVTEALATLHPPDYAADAPSSVVDLQASDATAVVGSSVTVSVQCSKPVGADASGRPKAALAFDDGQDVPVDFGPDGGLQALEASFELQSDAHFRVRVADANGLQNHAGRPYRIRAAPDQPPAVVVLEPQALVEVTPGGSVEMVIRAEDDFGISALRLVGREIDSETPVGAVLTERLRVTPAGDRTVALADYVWDLAPLNLPPGATVVYQAEAADNYRHRGASPQVGRSPQGRLKIISPAEFERRLGDEFRLLHERMRQAILDQESLHDQTLAIRDEIGPEPSPSVAQAESIMRLAARQASLAKRIQGLGDRLQRIARRMKANNLDNPALLQQVGDLAGRLQETAAGPAAAASQRLSQAGDPSATNPQSLLDQAGVSQTETSDALAAMIRIMDQWGDFEEAVVKTRDLLDRQQVLRRQVAERGQGVLGQTPESLGEQDRAHLRQSGRSQRQLAEEAEQLLEHLRQLADRLRGADPAGAAALEEAVRAGVAADAPRRMGEAAGAIEANRITAAGIEQRGAESALADMLAGLTERRKRELAELSRRIEDARDAVRELLRQQRELLEANVEARHLTAGADVFVKQADQQRTLEGNARRLGDDVEELHQAAGPARLVRRSAEPMAQAEAALRKADSPTAGDHQGQAAELLAQALTELDEAAREAAEQAWKRSLAALKAKLESIRNTQQTINDESAPIIALAADPLKTLGRKEHRAVRRLAKAQDELGPAVAEVRQLLGDAAVYRWVIDRVLELIGRSCAALEARKLDSALADTQGQIVAELDVLIGALVEAAALPPPDEYADGQAGGGGAAGVEGAAGPVPGIAELLVLKSMQLDLNDQTVRAAADFTAESASEQQLRQLQQLAARQEKIRELTETVTRQAQGDRP